MEVKDVGYDTKTISIERNEIIIEDVKLVNVNNRQICQILKNDGMLVCTMLDDESVSDVESDQDS